jgi:hypothetical protein
METEAHVNGATKEIVFVRVNRNRRSELYACANILPIKFDTSMWIRINGHKKRRFFVVSNEN